MSFVDYTGGVTPTMDLSAEDQNIFNPSTYGNAGGLTVGALLNSGQTLLSSGQAPISGSSLSLPGITQPSQAPANSNVFGSAPGSANPEGTGTPADPNLANRNSAIGGNAGGCSWTFFGLCLTRIFVVLLGVIFVAVGLSMFGKQAGIPTRLPVIPE